MIAGDKEKLWDYVKAELAAIEHWRIYTREPWGTGKILLPVSIIELGGQRADPGYQYGDGSGHHNDIWVPLGHPHPKSR